MDIYIDRLQLFSNCFSGIQKEGIDQVFGLIDDLERLIQRDQAPDMSFVKSAVVVVAFLGTQVVEGTSAHLLALTGQIKTGLTFLGWICFKRYCAKGRLLLFGDVQPGEENAVAAQAAVAA